MKRFILLLCIAVCFSATASAQVARTIAGTVTDTEGEPLIGATVLAVGTSIGSATDVDGNFSLSITEEVDSLLVSYVGYDEQSIPLDGSSFYDITLFEGLTLDVDIVVSGQGVGIERKRLTSTISSIDATALEATPTTSIDQLLQSRLEGTQIRLSSGQPGTASIIRNRGPISANGASTPIVIIDGVRVDNLNGASALNVGTGGASSSAIADIPVESIESVEFIRGGAATTLYGADAANGVLQIFTKKGTAGKARFNLETNLGFSTVEDKFFRFDQTKNVLYDDPGFYQQYRAGVNGGNDRVTYNFSGSYLDDDGIDAVDYNRRASISSGVSASVTDDLTYNGSASFVSNYFTRDYNANTSFSRIGFFESGRAGLADDQSSGFIDTLARNLQLEADNTNIAEVVRRFTNSNALEWSPFKNFTAKYTIGLDSRSSEAQNIATNELLVAKGANAEGTANQGTIERVQRDFTVVTNDLALQYRLDLDNDLSFISNVGGQIFRENDRQIEVNASNVVEGSALLTNSADQQVDQFIQELTYGGFYLYENIGFKNKLFLDLGARFDFNSAFGDEVDLVDLYRVGLVYSLTDEEFMQTGGIAEVISRASFRANFGQASNFPTPFARDREIAANTYLDGVAFTLGNPGNPNLRPEIVESYEAGGDFSLFNARLSLGFTYYDQTTLDALFTPPSAPSRGELNQEANVGEISNTGVELTAGYEIIRSTDFDLSINASLTTNKNEVVSSGGAPEFTVGGFQFLGSFIKEGQPLGYFRSTQPIYNAEGAFEGVNRNVALGSPVPDGYGNLSVNFRWRNLTFFTSADYQYGAQGVNLDDALRYARGVSDPGRIPQATINNNPSISFALLGSEFIEDTDFVKIRNIGATYRIPTQSMDFIQSLSVGFNAINPLAFASSSFDPEVTGAGIGAQGDFSAGGFGFGTISNPKRYLLSLKGTF